mgnify:CR=1 FL=1
MNNKLKRKASSAKSIIPFANRQTQHMALKLLKEKYGIDVVWSENTQKTIDRFGL